MFRILGDGYDRNCQGVAAASSCAWAASGWCAGWPCRSFWRQGEAGLAEGYLRGKSVVLLFLQGGPSHIEFFDPKMTAPAEIRSITGEVQTKLPGVTFGGTFPKLARAGRQARPSSGPTPRRTAATRT